MIKAVLILLAMTILVGSAVAGFDNAAVTASPCQQGCGDKWNEGKCCEENCDHQLICTEICPGKWSGHECGCDHGDKGKCDRCEKKEPCNQCDKKQPCNQCDKKQQCDQCDKKQICDRCGKEHSCNSGCDDGKLKAVWPDHPGKQGINCFVFEKCDECGKTVCDGICPECHAKACVYEYCSVCGVKYSVEHADGICDRCGRDCYCIEKCEKCDYSHYFNGWCDECADRCYYGRCCARIDVADGCKGKESCSDSETQVYAIFLGNKENEKFPGMEGGYPVMEGMNVPMQDDGKEAMQ